MNEAVRLIKLSAELPHLPSTLEECHSIIREYHTELKELKQMVSQFMARVEKLEVENRELRARLNSDSNNSSKPPSRDFKKNKKQKQSSGKPSGGQKGHRGHFRALMDEKEVDAIVNCEEFSKCDCCGGDVAKTSDFVRHQVHELPEIKLHVTEYHLAHGACQNCSRKQLAKLPEGISWGITGPRLTSFMTEMVTKYQLSRRGLREFLSEHLNFRISLGTVFNKQRLVNQILEAPVRALLPVIKQNIAVNIDETGHRQSSKNHWVWTVACKSAAYFEITPSRGKKVLYRLMSDYEHNVISDRYAVYNYFDSRRQLCWAHLKRDFTKIWQKEDKVISRIGKGLLECEKQLFKHWYRFKKSEITRETLLIETAPVLRAIGEYLEQGSYTDPKLKVARFCKNILERFEGLRMFLEVDGVEPTNNHAERCLRFLVIWRKKYFTTHSTYGSEYVARTASLNTTAKLQAINPFQYLSVAIRSWFSGHKIPPIIEEPIRI
jgi:transposase